MVFGFLLMVAGIIMTWATMPLETSGRKKAFLAGLGTTALGVLVLSLTLLVAHPGLFWFSVAVALVAAIYFPVQRARAVATARAAANAAKVAFEDVNKDLH